jgi:hypothetical protein
MVAERGVQLPPDTRLLLEALRALEQRVAALEQRA